MKQSLHLSITLFMLHSSYVLLSCGWHADLCVLSGSLLWPCFQHKTEREIEPLPPQMCSGSSSVASVSISAINFRLPDEIQGGFPSYPMLKCLTSKSGIFFVMNVFCMLFIKEVCLWESSRCQRHRTIQTLSVESEAVTFLLMYRICQGRA